VNFNTLHSTNPASEPFRAMTPILPLIWLRQVFLDMIRAVHLKPILLFCELLVGSHELIKIFGLLLIFLKLGVLNSDAFFQNLVFVSEVPHMLLNTSILGGRFFFELL